MDLSHIPQIDILGIKYHNVSMSETIDIIERMIISDGTNMICTPNADHIVQAEKDEEFHGILLNSQLVIPDGMAVVYASFLLGTPLKGNVGGRLLALALGKKSAEKGYKIFFLGGANDQTAERAVENYKKLFSGVNVAGVYNPPYMDEFMGEENEKMLETIHRIKPDILFVCLGTPKQEKWIYRNIHNIDAKVIVGIGATMDILAGKVRQPPKWVTRIGFEWLFRLAQDPRRLYKRYLLDDPIFFWNIIKKRLNR